MSERQRHQVMHAAGVIVRLERPEVRVARVRLASTPADRFIEHLEALQHQVDHLPDEAVRQVLDDIVDLRRQALAAIAGLDGFERYRLEELDKQLADLADRFLEQYHGDVAGAQSEMFTLGTELAARPLVGAGVAFHVPQLSRRLAEVAEHYQALLISHATDDLLGRISDQLRLGALQGSSVPDVLKEIVGTLTEPGPFASLSARAETITRTELGRIQSIATQAGLLEVQRLVPDLQKQWAHSRRRSQWMREGHVDADGQVRSVDAPFRVRPDARRPYEDLMYPRDAKASPENTINCGCSSVPFRAEWSSAIEAANQENQAFLAARAGGQAA